MIKQLRVAIFENGTQKAKQYADGLFDELTEATGLECSVINVYDQRPCTQVLPVRVIPNVAVLLFANTLEEGQEIVQVCRQLDYFRRQQEAEAAGERLIAEGVAAGTVDGTQVVESMVLLPSYRPEGAGDYEHPLGESCVSDGQPWRCCQGYNAKNNPGITPGHSPAHWVQYHTKDPARALPFVQPTGAHDVYMAGECMVWTDGEVYKSKQDNNPYSPESSPDAWAKAGEAVT